MASSPIRDLSEYPRPWFYRPEIYYGFFIFPPVWSILTLRSPWHNRSEGFRGILTGGVAWFLIIASVVLSVRWVQEGGVVNLFIFVPRPAAHAGNPDTMDRPPCPLWPAPRGAGG